MTDKQIIIDGCDVSGCSLYEDNPKYRMWGTCDCMRSMVDQSGYDELAGAECKGYNCYYKQLKRKEQECEELKEERNEYFELMAIRTEVLAKIANKLGMNTGIIENKELFCKIDQLKAENEHLNDLLNQALKELEILQKISECEVENERKENCN